MKLITDRLTIRPWEAQDLPSFAGINADADVRRYFYPAVLTRAQSDAVVDECMQHLSRHGFAFLAVERTQDRSFIGGAGLSWTDIVPGGPVIEIGWILGQEYWRKGYAREVSHAWFDHGWSLGLEEIIGYTSALNYPSRAVMTSLGMIRNPAEDFPDPTVPEGNPLRPHVLYRMRNPEHRDNATTA